MVRKKGKFSSVLRNWKNIIFPWSNWIRKCIIVVSIVITWRWRCLNFYGRLCLCFNIIFVSVTIRYMIKCCTSEKFKTVDCETKTFNDFQQDMNYQLPKKRVIAGLYSVHRNDKEYVFFSISFMYYFMPFCNTEQNWQSWGGLRRFEFCDFVGEGEGVK